MTKRKPRKSLRGRPKKSKMLHDQQLHSPNHQTSPADTDTDDVQIIQLNPNQLIEKEEEETLQSETACTNPKLIERLEEESNLSDQNAEVFQIPEEAQVVQIDNPKTLEKEDEITTDSVSAHEDTEIQSLNTIVEEEEEEEEEEDHGNQVHEEEEDDEEDNEEEEKLQTEGMVKHSPMLISSPAHNQDIIICELVSESPPVTLPSKSARKRKKPSSKYQRKSLNHKQRVALEKKLHCCRENLQPIPFVPTKTLDFSKHENLFKRLGLWDFVHIEFDHEIRSDLLVQLIVNYHSRCSTVNDSKIKVSRADLGRALKLPPAKKDKNITPENMDLDTEVLSQESISFLEEFVSNWFLLHEDMWMMPDEVLTNTRCIKEGQPEKVDWPGLIWFMVEKEISQGPKLKSCYYASHLQCLIRSQKDVLFNEEPNQIDVHFNEGPKQKDVLFNDEPKQKDTLFNEDPKQKDVLFHEEPKLVESMEQKEEVADGKRRSLEEIQEEELKKHIDLTLGQERNDVEQQVRDEDVMDLQECKEPGDSSSHWFLDGKNSFEAHCFRRCDNVVKTDGVDDQCAVKEEEHEEEKYNISSKFSLEGGLASTDLLQGMGTNNHYSPSMQLQLLDDNSGELLQTRSNTHINQGGPSVFGNTCKRELISHEEDEDEENEGIPRDLFSKQNKRMKNNSSWENKTIDMDYCMEQMTIWMGKAREIHAQKDEACINAQMNQEYLMSELQQRDNIIATLHKTKCEEIQKREVEMYKLEHELRMMGSLVVGYRTALKQTQREFSEYRERCLQSEEPLYKDVPGGGGLVVSTTELEKQRLEREKEVKMQREFFTELIKEFELSYIGALEASNEKVSVLDQRLLVLKEEFKVLKEIVSAKHKMPEVEPDVGGGCIAEDDEV